MHAAVERFSYCTALCMLVTWPALAIQGAGSVFPALHASNRCPIMRQVGMVACNDYILLESCIYRILQRHFAAAPYYAQLLELFHEVEPRVFCCRMHASQVAQLCD